MMKKFLFASFLGILVTFTNQLVIAQTQSITVDTTITADCEFYPFSSSGPIYGLSLTGSVNLASDTSLIRVVLIDTLFNEYLVYESYPLIADTTSFNFSNVCDETCYLDGISPYSLKVQVVSATLSFSTITYNPIYINKADSLQLSAKQTVELNKVAMINSFINENKMLWFADTTSLSNMSYQEKETLFGSKFNLRGFDYYTGGIFIPWGEELREIDNSTLIEEWDWRNRHGANDPTKGEYYYVGNKAKCPRTFKHIWFFCLRTKPTEKNQKSLNFCKRTNKQTNNRIHGLLDLHRKTELSA